MRTLFGANIHSPSSLSPPDRKHDPFSLHFHAPSYGSSPTGTPSLALSPLSGSQDEWLIKSRQAPEHRYSHDDDASFVVGSRRHSRGGVANQKGIPKVLIMGLSRSGKSSIQHVILKTKSAGETLYLEPTNQIVESATLQSFIKLECVEVPSNLNFTAPDFNHETIFGSAGSVVWVIDIQDENIHSIHKLISTATFLMTHYPRIHFEVFVHKTDGLSDEYKTNTVRDVRQNIEDELNDRGFAAARAAGAGVLAFHSTSIYDASVFEAMSKVVQRLLPQLPALEALLTQLCSKCSMQKVYLFDTTTRIYLATDASPTFLRDFEVCSEYVDMIVDAKEIYGWRDHQPGSTRTAPRRRRHRPRPHHTAEDSDAASDPGDDPYPPTLTASDTTLEDASFPPSPSAADSDSDASTTRRRAHLEPAVGESSITLPGSQDLYMLGREISDYLSLVCILGGGSTPERRVLIDYNVALAAEAVRDIFRL